MFNTTHLIEEQLPEMQKILCLEKEPKWCTLRFAIFMSLSLKEELDMNCKINFEGGINYKTEVITGKNKSDILGTQADYNDIIAIMMSNYHNCELDDSNTLDKLLERHCIRGFDYLGKNLNSSSSIFLFLKNEFIA